MKAIVQTVEVADATEVAVSVLGVPTVGDAACVVEVDVVIEVADAAEVIVAVPGVPAVCVASAVGVSVLEAPVVGDAPWEVGVLLAVTVVFGETLGIGVGV